jgi:amidase
MDVLAGRATAARLAASDSFLTACERPPSSLRIRLLRRSPLVAVDTDVVAATVRAAHALEDLGHRVEEAEPLAAEIDEFIPLMARMVANVPVPPFLNGPAADHALAPQPGKQPSRTPRPRAFRSAERRVLDWFGDADAWLMPTVAAPAPRVGAFADRDGEGVFRAAATIGAFTAPFNASGQPAASIPAGLSRAGLPIGVQLILPHGGDHRLLGLAAALEETLAVPASAPGQRAGSRNSLNP